MKAKKILALTLAVASVGALSVGLAACGEEEQTYNGEYKYTSAWEATQTYGVKVEVKVKGDKIVSVTCKDDTETYFNITASWTENARPGDLGHDKAAAALPDYLKKFEGKKVADIKALEVGKETSGEPTTTDDAKAKWSDYVLTGATQTSGRIILAVQDALKDVK